MRRAVPLRRVVDGLTGEGLLSGADAAQARAVIERLQDIQPWYVRTMVGIGAWLASLLLIGFVAGFSLAVGGSALVGLGLVVAAVLVRTRASSVAVFKGSDFVVQSSLAASLAGQALLAWGMADALSDASVEWLCVIVMGLGSVLFFAFPDRIHRVLMVLFVTCALVVLMYARDLAALVPVVGPLLALGLVVVHRRRPELYARGRGALVRPLEDALMLASFGCLMLSTVYVLPELDADLAFYPRPWVSTLMLAALMLYVAYPLRADLFRDAAPMALPVAGALALTVVAAAWWAPGLLLALIVVLLGAARGQAAMTCAGIAFLVVFTAAFFYGIEVGLLTKSITLAATGGTVLLARWLLLAALGAPRHG